MVYDVTTPTTPLFMDYVNNRDFSVDPATAPTAGDLGPEGLIFISGQDSPTRNALLVAASEISGTVTIYEVAVEHD
jgi:2',3'-cyclic-nucleotide 2'-phosphodiesterase/3'-nucleotidase/5'-nucleotidase